MRLQAFLDQYQTALSDLCRMHRVSKLYVFGSLAKGQYNAASSDVDMIVKLDPMSDPVEKGLILMAFWDAVEALLGQKVDLLTDQPIKNPLFRDAVEKSRVLIYDGASEKVSD